MRRKVWLMVSEDDAALLEEGVQDVKQEALGSADESALDSSSSEEEQDPVNGGEDSPRTVGTPSIGWVLNTVTGVAHLAADREGLACRPKLELNGNYQHWSSNPLVLGFAPCQHSGCRTAHELWWCCQYSTVIWICVETPHVACIRLVRLVG